jgi:hypothetical protein
MENGKKQNKLKQKSPSPQNTSRRAVLKKMTVGAGALAGLTALPNRWTRPITELIVLPAHAQTSQASLHDPCSTILVNGDTGSLNVAITVTGFVTPATANLATTIVATPVPVGAPVTANVVTEVDGTFSADITVTGGPGITTINVTTTVAGADGTANCSLVVPPGSVR